MSLGIHEKVKSERLYKAFDFMASKNLEAAESELNSGLDEALQKEDDILSALFYSSLGVLFKIRKDFQKAWKYYEKAEKLLPEDPALKLISARLLIDVFGPAFEVIFELVSAVLSAAWTGIFKPVFEWIMEYIGLVIDTFDALLSALEGDLKPLSKVLDKMRNFFLDTFNTVITAVVQFAKDLINNILGALNTLVGMVDQFGIDFVNGIINGIKQMGGQIVSTIMGFIPTPESIANAAMGAVSGAADFIGNAASAINPFDDFIARPGMGIQAFSPQDTIIGVKDVSDLVGTEGGGVRTTTVYIENVNVASDYDVDDFKRRLAEDTEDSWARRQNR